MNKSKWPRMKIADLFDVQLGKMLNEKAKQGNLYPYLANFNVRWGSFELSRLNEMAFSEKEQKKYSLSPGDLLMCEGGEIGRCAVWEGLDKRIFFQKALHRLRPLNKNIKSEFVYYYMQHIASKGDLPKIVGETSIAHLTREKLLELSVPVPSIQEQASIVALLSTWDAAIEKTERIVAAKEKHFRWLLIQLLSSRMRVREFSEKWTPYSFNEIFTTHQVINSNNYNYPVLSVTKGGIVNQSEYFNKEIASDDKSNYLIVERGNFVMSGLNFWMGSVDFQNICDIGIVSPAYKVFRVNKADINPDYIRFYVRSPMMTKILTQASIQGASIVRRNLDMKYLNESQILLPSLKEQEAITEILLSTEKELLLHSQQLTAYKAQKRGLMQKLLTGQWRVKLNDEVTYGK